MEIEINNTPDAKDDLVKLKCEHPAHLSSVVDCRIRSTEAPGEGSATVVLTSPDGRLRFLDDKTTTLSVPKDGSWVSFQISGEEPSEALGDAVIEAHCSTKGGEVKASKSVTVFWFDEKKIEVNPTGVYSLTGNRYTTPTGKPAVIYSAQARIRPEGVDCSAPQIKNLRVGIMQNTKPPTFNEETWTNPKMNSWLESAASGTKVKQPKTMLITKTITVAANDTDPSVSPLYDQPHAGYKDSLKPPIGCTDGAAAASNDTPNVKGGDYYPVDAFSTEDEKVGVVHYTKLIKATQASKFITWAVLFDTETKDFCPLRERAWKLKVDSSGHGPQKATAEDSDSEPDTTPVKEPETAVLFAMFRDTNFNPDADKRVKLTKESVGEGVIVFTKK